VSIFINKETRLVVQGITGRDGSFHSKQMLEYGTAVVAGVTPGKGGQKFEGKVPIFNTVADRAGHGGAPIPANAMCLRALRVVPSPKRLIPA
jgi:succinyl-CoA synthetase alpha subunit